MIPGSSVHHGSTIVLSKEAVAEQVVINRLEFASPHLVDVNEWGTNRESLPGNLFGSRNNAPQLHNLYPIYESHKSAVFCVDNPEYGHVAVVYRISACEVDSQELDTTIIEYSILQMLHGDPQIVPDVYFLSGPTSPGLLSSSGKIKSSRDNDADIACVRYIVMDRTGKSLAQLLKLSSRIPYSQALALFSQMVQIVREIHSKGVVHGNIVLEHFVLKYGDPNGLLLIDF